MAVIEDGQHATEAQAQPALRLRRGHRLRDAGALGLERFARMKPVRIRVHAIDKAHQEIEILERRLARKAFPRGRVDLPERRERILDDQAARPTQGGTEQGGDMGSNDIGALHAQTE